MRTWAEKSPIHVCADSTISCLGGQACAREEGIRCSYLISYAEIRFARGQCPILLKILPEGKELKRIMKDEQSPALPPVEAKDYYAVMVHFYRGELGRIMIWRQRLDVTTNWAIVGTTAMITFALGSVDNTHLIFLFANFLAYLLLTIEARRYRYYDAFRARVRMLEAHFIMPVMMRNTVLLQGDWKKLMAEDLLLPSFKMSRLTAILRRYRRNYVWIFLIIAAAWFVKIWIHYPDSHTVRGFISALAINHPLPAEVFWSLFALCYLVLSGLTVGAFLMREHSGEFQAKAMRRKKWMK